jgi:energy-coupling factor transporter ATP-binding protein EcfA2
MMPMRIASVRLRGVRCFEDTGDILLGRGCNIFVGQNNSGKSTLLRSITDFEIRPAMREEDARPYAPFSITELVLTDISSTSQLNIKPPEGAERTRYCMRLKGEHPPYPDMSNTQVLTASDVSVFTSIWPTNFIVPFSAKRKSSQFDQNVSTGAQSGINGTFSNLYARVDRVASPGMSAHERYRRSVEAIVGVLIATRSALGGKEAGYYFDDDNFVTLDRMGDGVSEMVALIVELSLAKDKVFVLEEPETNLHPKGLKALLNLVRESAANNQFIIATHSNVVVRELAADGTKIFRVYRDGDKPSSPSRVDQVEESPIAHRGLLRELGYEFGDFDLHDVWLFLEEASAETDYT